MPQVNFVTLFARDLEQAVCRWIAALYASQASKTPCYVHCLNQEQAIQLDAALWTFDPNAFIPHALILDRGLGLEAPIHLGYLESDVSQFKHASMLLNLSEIIPSFFTAFETVVELVLMNDETDRAIKRKRYIEYRRLGCQPLTSAHASSARSRWHPD